MTASKLEAIRDGITERLTSLTDDFEGVTILSRKIGDIQNQIAESVAKVGICIVVMVTSGLPRAINSREPYIDPVRVIVRVVEDVLINQSSAGTQKGAMAVAERVVAALQYWQPAIDGVKVLTPESPGIQELNVVGKLNDERDNEDIYAIDVHFTTRAALTPITA